MPSHKVTFFLLQNFSLNTSSFFLLISLLLKLQPHLEGHLKIHFPPSSMIKEVHNDVSISEFTILISIICFGPSLCSNGYGVFILPRRLYILIV